MTLKSNISVFALLSGFAGLAAAQSSVTLYGSYDNGLRDLTHANAAGQSQLTTGSVGLFNSNRFGLTGEEDLGDGLKAHFRLESAFNGGTGAGTAGDIFSRESTIGLSGAWGDVNVGRQFSVSARTAASYDPFSFRYLSIIPLDKILLGSSSDRLDNDIQYTGTFGNLLTRAEYAPGGEPGSFRTGTVVALGATYRMGGARIGGAYSEWDGFGGPGLNRSQATVGGDYRVGKLRIAGGLIDDKSQAITGPQQTKDAWIGTVYDFTSAFQLTDAYYWTDSSAAGASSRKVLWMAGVTYALSKRTSFYAEIDNSQLGGTAIVDGQSNQTGFAIGINQWF